MSILLKIEATFLIISITVFLLMWLVSKSADNPRGNPMVDFAKHLARLSLLASMVLLLLMAITALWTYF